MMEINGNQWKSMVNRQTAPPHKKSLAGSTGLSGQGFFGAHARGAAPRRRAAGGPAPAWGLDGGTGKNVATMRWNGIVVQVRRACFGAPPPATGPALGWTG